MAGTPEQGFGLLWILRTVSRKSRRIGFHHLGGLEKMLPVLRIIAVFTVVWSVGPGIADEKNRRGARLVAIGCQIVAIRCQAVDNGASKASTVWRQVATVGERGFAAPPTIANVGQARSSQVDTWSEC